MAVKNLTRRDDDAVPRRRREGVPPKPVAAARAVLRSRGSKISRPSVTTDRASRVKKTTRRSKTVGDKRRERLEQLAIANKLKSQQIQIDAFAVKADKVKEPQLFLSQVNRRVSHLRETLPFLTVRHGQLRLREVEVEIKAEKDPVKRKALNATALEWRRAISSPPTGIKARIEASKRRFSTMEDGKEKRAVGLTIQKLERTPAPIRTQKEEALNEIAELEAAAAALAE